MPPRTLVALAHRHGTAAVRRGAHGAMLVSDVRHDGGTGIADHRPAVEGLRDHVTLSGGLLPPRAVRAVVYDRAGHQHEATCGDGAWLALLDQPVTGEAPLVRFLDAQAELVPVPVPAGVRLEDVPDAIDPCPVCDARAWRKVTAAPEGRYGSDGAGRPTAAICARCGFEESLGVLYAAPVTPSWPPEEDVDDTEAEIAEREALARRARIDDARSSPFPFYGLVAGSPVTAGLGTRNGAATSITLAYETPDGPVQVMTDTDHWLESPFWLARGALEGISFDADWPELSDTAVLLWLNARTRERVAEAHRAPVSEVAVTVDAEPITFMTASLRDEYAAAARLGGTTILVSGHGTVDGLALRTVSPGDLESLR